MSEEEIHSIVNDLPTRRGTCGKYFHDLNSGGQARICSSTPDHAGLCSDNVPTADTIQKQQDRQKLNTNYDSYMRTILPDFFKDEKQ